MSAFRKICQPAGICVLLTCVTLLLVGSALAASGTVYRCEGPDGVQFSDQPFGPDPETVIIRDNRVGGSVGDNLPDFDSYPENDPPEQDEPLAAEDETCRFISSTDLRTYLAREQVVPGMTRKQVERAFGRTSEVYPTPQETWVYQTRHYGALYELTYVYFRNGCVERVEYRKP
ncbi:DUF4124 domain-containing protein [Marinobacter orientalis]|uniref:DUF4124 domain-containing protein n=1 Tax=Marinobacter orientalis TaxID=1928859 RepID=A0A7Y0RC41_9GAMM|nr:DUF4124 domain-containing protein [Marinobacter orientalis]NMT63493.1 DUF4124 domain-containing protein [Marinobacter orientalis]TGX48553.1 DUF4124 domain-containing protein [Marinobacter orientalis]